VLAAIPAGAPTHLELATHYVDHAVSRPPGHLGQPAAASGAAVLLTQRGPGGGRPPTAPTQPGPVSRRIGVRSSTERRFQQPVVAREPGR